MRRGLQPSASSKMKDVNLWHEMRQFIYSLQVRTSNIPNGVLWTLWKRKKKHNHGRSCGDILTSFPYHYDVVDIGSALFMPPSYKRIPRSFATPYSAYMDKSGALHYWAVLEVAHGDDASVNRILDIFLLALLIRRLPLIIYCVYMYICFWVSEKILFNHIGDPIRYLRQHELRLYENWLLTLSLLIKQKHFLYFSQQKQISSC